MRYSFGWGRRYVRDVQVGVGAATILRETGEKSEVKRGEGSEAKSERVEDEGRPSSSSNSRLAIWLRSLFSISRFGAVR